MMNLLHFNTEREHKGYKIKTVKQRLKENMRGRKIVFNAVKIYGYIKDQHPALYTDVTCREGKEETGVLCEPPTKVKSLQGSQSYKTDAT